ncbi:MAG: helix-turn-helix domain-containing protein [Ruminococcaceae bacterium]|nr:helix-turn-helix domain-containing protein [Oscillospiraceae bacterium]
MAITTEEFKNRINSAKSTEELKEVLKSLPQTTFGQRLCELCDEHGMKLSEVQILSGITKSSFYWFIDGTRTPKKSHIIRIGVAMGLSVEQLNELLKLAKHKELYAKNKDDAIIMFGLKNNLSDIEISELLEEEKSTFKLLEF